MSTRGSEFAALLSTLSALEQGGRRAEARLLRGRIRVALRDLPLDELHDELASVEHAAGGLTHPAQGDGSGRSVPR